MKKNKKSNTTDSGPLLDLHGCTTDDAIRKLDQFLVRLNERNFSRARVMTGKGTGALQKAVTEYLRLGGYPFQFEKLASGQTNEGVLVLFLK